MKHVPIVCTLLALLLVPMARNVSPGPYIYDEADYMYAASFGFHANYTDTPSLPIGDFLRIGLQQGREAGQKAALSELIRRSDDVLFYRHWHGPLFHYLLAPLSRLGWNEHATRLALLVIPAMSLVTIYFGCLWLVPGPRAAAAAVLGSVLFLASGAVVRSSELAPHQLFVFCSLCALFLLAKAVATANPTAFYLAVVFSALAFCAMEIALVLILTLAIFGYRERRGLAADWRFVIRSAGLFLAAVMVVWPAAIFKLSFVKAYLFMAYLAIFRQAPWGQEGFQETWRLRFLDSPLVWVAVAASLVVYWKNGAGEQKRAAGPFLVYGLLALLATLRVLSGMPRYALPFEPALAVFSGITLASVPVSLRKKTGLAALAAFLVLLGITSYRIFAPPGSPDPRPPAILNYIRENKLTGRALLVPQEDLPMIHYYFPAARPRGYYGIQPGPADRNGFAPDAILDRGYPVRFESRPPL